MADGPDSPPPALPLRERLTAPGATLAPLNYPAFRAIWSANMLSQLGTTIQSVGAAWLMTDLTRSHTLVAAVQSSSTLPILLLGMFAGAIADNFDRRRVMIAAQGGMLALSTLLAVLAWMKVLQPWSLLGITLMMGIGTALNAPAWHASVRVQVGKRDLPAAIALNTIAFNLARSLGPALGGLLISLFSVSLAFGLNATTFLVMVVVLLNWKPEAPAPARQPILPSVMAGVRFCASSDPLRRVLIRGMCAGIGLSAFNSLMPLVVRDHLHGTELDFGIVLGGVGVGSIAAALVAGAVRKRFGTEQVVNAAMTILAVGTLALGAATSLVLMIAAALLLGIGWVLVLTTLNVAMQLRSPENILGRCLSIYQAVTWGAMAVGAWSWGLLSDLTSLSVALDCGALFLLGTMILLRMFVPMPAPHEGRVQG